MKFRNTLIITALLLAIAGAGAPRANVRLKDIARIDVGGDLQLVGYGLVVGLNGTGSRDIPPAVRAHMVQEMARRGIGSEAEGYGHLKPDAMLDSPDTAVVIVEGVVPPGAVGRQVTALNQIHGTIFDVRVKADHRTGTTSLEGGRLYTAELRPALPGQILPEYATDINRSGTVNARDILDLIDLLNGAGAHATWWGQTLSPDPCD